MLFVKVCLSVKEEQNQKDNASLPPLSGRRLKGVFAGNRQLVRVAFL